MYTRRVRRPTHLFRFLSTRLPIYWETLVYKQLIEIWKIKKKPLRILDLGSGPGRYWLNGKLSGFMRESNSELFLLDACTEFDTFDSSRDFSSTFMQGIIPDALLAIPENSFDYVLAIDLIEHLSKDQGYLLLYEIDRICGARQTLMTPNGFVWQPPSLNNPWNAHISGWKPSEFRSLGYSKIRGQIGSKINYGPYGLPKKAKKNWIILEILAIDSIVTYFFPRISLSFIATKYKKNPRIAEQL